jgi:hypothetical protein
MTNTDIEDMTQAHAVLVPGPLCLCWYVGVTILKEEYTISEKWRALVIRSVHTFFCISFPRVSKSARCPWALQEVKYATTVLPQSL